MTYARVRDDLADEGARIHDRKTGRYYGADTVGRALIHSSDDYYGTVAVLTDAGAFLIFDSIDLDYSGQEGK